MAELDLSRGWRIDAPSEDPTAALAAAELEGWLSAIAGMAGAGGGEERAVLALRHGQQGDGFSWRVQRNRVELHGDGPRGLLYAGYSLLEALGCRWVWPGEAGRRVARGVRFRLPDAPVQEKPALPERCLVIGHRAFLADVDEWILWAARNRLNCVFIHVSWEEDPFGAAPERLWQERRAAALLLCRERGMKTEHGGHLMPRLRTRSELDQHFRAHPEVDVFHLWGADLPPPGPAVGPEFSNRALADANAAAEVLEASSPAAVLSFLAYHETEQVPAGVRPRRNVCLLWAPRERCYAHPADADGCPLNRRYRETFAGQLEHFASAGAAPARVFEYYLDSILFRPAPPPFPELIRQDLDFYRRIGAHAVQALMTGYGAWREPHPNAWLFARLAWDPDRDADALLHEFSEVAFDGDPRARAQRYRALELEAGRRLARGHP